MYRFENVDYGPTQVTVEAATLRESLDLVGHLYSLHEDALFLEAHVQFFHDVEPVVVPKSKTDDEGYTYRGFRCLRTGCNITFKEQEGEALVFPGRHAAYRNGQDKPKLYDPVYNHDEILTMVDPDTPFVQRFRVDVGQNGGAPSRGGRQRREGPPPQQQRERKQPPPERPQSGSMPSTGVETVENLPLPAGQGPEILEKGWRTFVDVPEKAEATLASWDDSFGEIEDVETLREAIVKTETVIESWDSYQRVANTMLQYHRERLFRLLKEEMVHDRNGATDEGAADQEHEFEPDDELPF